jgi:GAF domain-containing protein
MTSSGTNLIPARWQSRPPGGERRRRGRHKTYAAAFAGMNDNSTGIALDLYEILNLSEDGMCFQSASQMEPGEMLNLCLDLCDPKTYIHTSGCVTWSEGSGRTGIRFQRMPEGDTRQLREWLLANALAQAAEIQAALIAKSGPSPSFTQQQPDQFSASTAPQAQTLTAEEFEHKEVAASVKAVGQEVASIAFDLDEALRIIAERTLTLTRSSGAAIALSSGHEMVCRASAGSDAPGLGARLKVGSGFSGECIRTGQLLYCEDSEIDPRVDRESCQLLGVRSIVAAPIRSAERVVGLLEVFAPQARAFGEGDKFALRRLTEIIQDIVQRATQAIVVPEMNAQQAHAVKGPPDTEDPTFDTPPEEPSGPLSSALRRIFLLTGLSLLLGVSLWVRWERAGTTAGASNQSISVIMAEAPQGAALNTGRVEVTDFKQMRQLAAEGDSEAQFSMGVRCATGDEVTQDYTEAARWFRLAAEQGHVMAQSTLGAYYWAGRGLSQDLNNAYFWAVLANAGGDEPSKVRLSFLASRMSQKEILAAQRQADEWLKLHQGSVESVRVHSTATLSR